MRRKLLPLLLLAAVAAGSLTCSPGYLVRAGIEEARILSRRRPIDRILEDPHADRELRRKLTVVARARTFARETLDLDVGDSYTTYSWIDRDTLALVLSAAHQDRFEEVTWWFPIVGDVPYKGFFDADAARREAERLRREGFDTYLRPTTAFSTLGWFNDPVLSTVLPYDDVRISATVIHELTHNTLYVPSQVAFNESFANFVGDIGAAHLHCAVEGDDALACREARGYWHDNLILGRFIQDLIAELEALYATPGLDRDAVLRRRERLLADARDRFAREVAPRFETRSLDRFLDRPLNNATLIAWRLYYDRLDLFDRIYRRHHGDLAATIRAIVAAVRASEDDPWAAVSNLAGEPG